EVPLPNPKGGYGGYFLLREKGEREGLPLRAFDARRDEWGDVLLFLEPGTWIDLVFSPASPAELKRLVKRASRAIRPDPRTPAGGWSAVAEIGLEALREFDPRRAGSKQRKPPAPKPPSLSELDPDEAARYRSLMDRFTGRERAFDVMLSVWSEHPHAASVVQSLATRIESMMHYQNGIRLQRTRRSPIVKVAPVPYPYQTMIWTAPELANIFHLPDGQHRVMERIPHLERGQRTFGKDEFSKGISMGTLRHPMHGEREARIPQDTFSKHFVITGVTGGGKSSLIITIFQSMIDNWLDDPDHAAGFTLFDPAQETALTVLNRLLEAERQGRSVPWEKVHYASLRGSQYPIGLNLLHNNDAETVLRLLQKVAPGANTPRMDRLAYNAVASLIEAGGNHTLLGVLPMIADEDFRNRVIPKIRDYYLQQFWRTEFESFAGGRDTSVDALINRLSPFQRNLDLRRMVGQAKWSIPIQKWMDEGHIFLIDFLNVDDTVKSLAGAHLINQYHYVAKSRPLGQRRLHFLVADEAHLVQMPIMGKILAEDRKFGLCLGLITQYPEQFESWLQRDLANIVVTIAACVQGSDSAGTMSKLLKGYFTPDQLQKLPERTAAITTRNERNEVDFFMTKCDPPYVYLPDGRVARYRNTEDEEMFLRYTLAKAEELQRRDWKPVQEVDREIEEYLQGGGTLLQEASDSGRQGSTTKTENWEGFREY
uniref:ATP-binding protein n=1 Tax=Effusibacillus pohliae TaxID=232270 RepID=UPI001B7FC0FD